MILFKVLRYKNLLSTGNQFTELNLASNKSTLIVGKNGHGKSTIIEALTFGLFGRAFRNINKPTLVNSINQRDCVVEIEFEANSKDYKIIRGIKPNIFEIWCNGKLINQDSSSGDYQKYLEKNILKMNFKSFTQIVILGNASFTPFMQLSAADRRSIIEDILDIQIFSAMNTIAKNKLQAIKDSIHDIRSELKMIEAKKAIVGKTIDSLESANETRFKQLNSEISEAKQKLIELESRKEELEGKKNDLTGHLSALPALRDKHSKMVKIQAKVEHNLESQNKHKGFYHDNSTCPQCKQQIDEGFKATIVSEVENKIETFQRNLKEIESKISEIIDEIHKLDRMNSELDDTRRNLAITDNTIKMKKSDIKRLEQEIEYLQESDTLLVENKEHLKTLNVNEKKQNDLLEQDLNQRQYLEMILDLLKDGGIKTKIIKQYLPIINKQINKYLTAMDFFVNFTIDESFSETIKSRHRDIFSYENFSEGEKMRIDLALMFTWRVIAKKKNSVSTNLLILDEVFDSSLDGNGTEDFMKIISELNDGTNIFVISHMGDRLYDKFDRVIKFEKVKSFSRIVE